MPDWTDVADASSEMERLFARPPLPGQHPEHSQRILDHLRRECGPRDFIEGLWLADVAWLTARIDYLRSASAGLYDAELRSRRSVYERVRELDRPFTADEFDRLNRAEDDTVIDGDPAPDSDPVFRRLLGLVTLAELDVLGKLAVLEQMLGRERDRVLAQFERRRRERVRQALDAVTIEGREARDQ